MKTVQWTITSSHTCEALREELDFWLYGPQIPTREHVREFMKALYEGRRARLSEAEAIAVRRWVNVEAMKRAIRERRWLLMRQQEAEFGEFIDRILGQETEDTTGRQSPSELLLGDSFLLVEVLYELGRHRSLQPKSPEHLLEIAIALQARVLLKGLADYATQELSETSRFRWETRVADIVALELIEKLPDAVSRAWEIQTSVVRDLPSRDVLDRLQEAYECFQYGYYQASIALCRSVLEHSLREVLRGRKVAPRVDYIMREGELAALITEAREVGILSPGLAKSADKIRKRGNACLHRRDAATREMCRETLREMRYILARLYK